MPPTRPAHPAARDAVAEPHPRALRGLKVTIDEKADKLVAELAASGSFEAIDSLARAFPIEIVADLIGFSGHVKDNMLRWGQAAMQVFGPLNQRTQESFPIAGELYGWCSSVTADDLAPGSIGRGIFDAETRGDIPEGSAGHIIHQYLGAGVDTTIASIGNIVALFGRHPEQFNSSARTRSLSPQPSPRCCATGPRSTSGAARQPATWRSTASTVPAGAQVGILFGAGNRDPRHYENPDIFDVTRNPVDHLSFGYGPHGCAGQGLAKLEAHAIIEALARRVKSLTIADEVRVPSNITRSHREAPGRQGGGSMRIELDRPRCEGHGLCEEAAPKLMHLDDDGELVIDVPEVDGAELDAAKAAVRVCPVAALRLAAA